MDHPCYKCGHSIEDGKAFCSQCSAPQIRVIVPEVVAEPVPAGHGLPPGPENELELGYPAVPASTLPGFWSHEARPCALAAAVAVLLVFLGLNPFVAALGAGSLAVVFSRRGSSGAAIRAGAGARLGALSGLLLFGASTVFEALAVAVLHRGGEIRNEMMDKVQQAATRYPSSKVQPFLDFVKSPGGLTFLIVASLIFGLVAFIALGSLGGYLGATFLRRRNRL
jgi:hypothetical protein